MKYIPLSVTLLVFTGCSLVGDPMLDPETGEYIASPLSAVLSSLGDQAPELATDAMSDGFGVGTITAIISAVVTAGAIGYKTNQRRKKIKAQRDLNLRS